MHRIFKYNIQRNSTSNLEKICVTQFVKKLISAHNLKVSYLIGLLECFQQDKLNSISGHLAVYTGLSQKTCSCSIPHPHSKYSLCIKLLVTSSGAASKATVTLTS